MLYTIYLIGKHMENTESPLKNFRRQPKIYISLPSQGKYYKDNIIANNTFTEIPVFSMTASDEILYKTPDAMITGNATSANIKSCIPSVLDPWNIITLDIDTLLIGIRMATYGDSMTVDHKCSCGGSNSYEINLNKYLEYYQNCKFIDSLKIDDFTFKIKPLTYRKWTEVQKKTVTLQRAINTQVTKIDDENEKMKALDNITLQINDLAISTIFDYVESIEVGGEIETNKNEIIDFMANQDLTYFKQIKEVVEKNIETWAMPGEKVVCSACKKNNNIRIGMDTSDFFGLG